MKRKENHFPIQFSFCVDLPMPMRGHDRRQIDRESNFCHAIVTILSFACFVRAAEMGASFGGLAKAGAADERYRVLRKGNL